MYPDVCCHVRGRTWRTLRAVVVVVRAAIVVAVLAVVLLVAAVVVLLLVGSQRCWSQSWC